MSLLLPLQIWPQHYIEHPLKLACSFPAAYHKQELVGAIACRLELHGDDAKLYIVTLGVLAPYRGMRVGAQLQVAGPPHINITLMTHTQSMPELPT